MALFRAAGSKLLVLNNPIHYSIADQVSCLLVSVRNAGNYSRASGALFANGKVMQQMRPIFVIQMRSSHARVFMRQQGHMIGNRMKDALHFYWLGLGFFPFLAILFFTHIFFGNCELADYPDPDKGEAPPRFWQFERTVLKQFWTRLFGVSSMEAHERNMSLCERKSILIRWRRYEQRVRHLIGERWDYKAYYYQPISARWVEHGREVAERMHYQWEEHGHYNQ